MIEYKHQLDSVRVTKDGRIVGWIFRGYDKKWLLHLKNKAVGGKYDDLKEAKREFEKALENKGA